MTRMTIIEALEKLASLNENGMYTIIFDAGKLHTDKPEPIEWVIDKIFNLSEVEAEITGLNEEFEAYDYYVDDSCIREIDDNGRLLYWVAEDVEYFD